MSNPFPLPKERLLDAYRKMRTIRDFEERLHVDFARGEIPGFVHVRTAGANHPVDVDAGPGEFLADSGLRHAVLVLWRVHDVAARFLFVERRHYRLQSRFPRWSYR